MSSPTAPPGPQDERHEQHTYRVTLRGVWAPTDEAERETLRAGLAEADGLGAMRFTPEGSLAYDRTLKAFSFRIELRSDAEDGEEMAAALAEERLEHVLRERGLRCGELRAAVTDLDTMKVNRKRRG
ncbi:MULTISPECIES: DUF6204 family protein [unclassified Streptomyces]|uniref:DUF6204 family protein n=1 Tax=unclassified Streptomyces TaxID=2593676 RepID=UPI00081E6046|nr:MULTISPECIES: DUF6204 family protein [unclassified Streptomyces]MYR28294.1 hypothetical protein [Streptomyces sp. SID4945]SCE02811.1 hypothetical protein GA0115251_136010 [Streptomyces sp. TverLS-915]SCF36286.1 hypothetical protein GA0115257_113810 [Streptomyces sp. LcepLS]